jgi:hypothetical protein
VLVHSVYLLHGVDHLHPTILRGAERSRRFPLIPIPYSLPESNDIACDHWAHKVSICVDASV